jgi:hypothetical protein
MILLRRHGTALSVPVLLVFLLTVLPLPALGQEAEALSVEGIPTNLGLAHQMASEVAVRVVSDLEDHFSGSRVILREGIEAAGNPVVRLAMAEALRKAGHRSVDSQAPGDAILEYEILDLRIIYTGVDRRALGLRAYVERAGNCVLAAKVVDPETGVDLASTQREVLTEDHFPKSKMELINSRTYVFTNVELEEKDWAKTLEPWVVGGLVLSLTWLFFSNQDSGE